MNQGAKSYPRTSRVSPQQLEPVAGVAHAETFRWPVNWLLQFQRFPFHQRGMSTFLWSWKCTVIGLGTSEGQCHSASETSKTMIMRNNLCSCWALYKEHRAESPDPWILALLPIRFTFGKSLNFLCISDDSCEYQCIHLGCRKGFLKT